MLDNSVFAVLLILRSVFSLFSLFGSGYIVQHVVKSPERRKKVFNRIMLGMSCMDFIFALYTAMSAFQLPPDTGLPWALGNWPSCTAFGFLGQGSRLSSILYNASLTLYYLLTIRYGWSERKCKKIEVWIHLVPLGIGWATAIAGFPLTLYNPLKMGCQIGGYPFMCDSRGNCQRGANAQTFQMAFFDAWVWAVLLWLVVAMTMIYQSVARTERNSERYSIKFSATRYRRQDQQLQENSNRSSFCSIGRILNPNTAASDDGMEGANSNRYSFCSIGRILAPNTAASDDGMESTTLPLRQQQQQPPTTTTDDAKKRRLRREFLMQAFLYCIVFFISWIFTIVATIMFKLGTLIFGIICFGSTVPSLQGALNAFIYIRPRYLKHRRERLQQKQQQVQNFSADQSNDPVCDSNIFRFSKIWTNKKRPISRTLQERSLDAEKEMSREAEMSREDWDEE